MSAPVTIRGAIVDGVDGERITRLAALTRTEPPAGAVLLAEIEGDPVAAIGIFDRRADARASSVLPAANDRLVEVDDGHQQRSTATASMSNVSRATLWSATPSASRRCMSRRVGNTNPSNVLGSCVYWAICGLPVTSGE